MSPMVLNVFIIVSLVLSAAWLLTNGKKQNVVASSEDAATPLKADERAITDEELMAFAVSIRNEAFEQGYAAAKAGQGYQFAGKTIKLTDTKGRYIFTTHIIRFGANGESVTVEVAKKAPATKAKVIATAQTEQEPPPWAYEA